MYWMLSVSFNCKPSLPSDHRDKQKMFVFISINTFGAYSAMLTD